jgi:hypothetical protein
MRQSNRTADGESHTTTDVSRRQVLTAVGLGGVAALAGCAGFGDTERETTDVQYDVSDDIEAVAISSDDGETTVEPWDGEDVRIEATKYAVGQTELSEIEVVREVTDGRLDIREERTTGPIIGVGGGGLESLTVQVPAGVRVTELNVDDGDATVTNVPGELALSIDDGDAEIGPLEGGLSVNGDDGDVTVDQVDRFSAELDDGAVTMNEPATIGDVRVDDGELDLSVDGVVDDSIVSADDGDVTVQLSSSLDATVVCTHNDGTVQFDDNVFDEVESTGNEFRGHLGDGSDRLTVDVDDGRISLEALS